MKTRLIFFIALFVVIGLKAQVVQIDTSDLVRPTNLPLQLSLWELSLAAQVGNNAAVDSILELKQIPQRRDGKVELAIIHPDVAQGPPTSVLEDLNIEVLSVEPYETYIFVPLWQIIILAEALPDGYVLYQSSPADPANEGPNSDVHNSISYLSPDGPGGEGIKIAVIDVGFRGLQTAIDSLWAPASFDSISFSSTALVQGSAHGTAVLQTIYDHAPNAEYVLYKASSVAQCIQAINDAVDVQNVDIINMSLGYRGLSWTDDDNNLCVATNNAADNGVLVFVSAGNRRQLHWKGMFQDNNSNGFHEWAPGVELNTIVLQDSSLFSVNLTWDQSQGTDYNLILFSVTNNQILDMGWNLGTTFESASYFNTTESPETIAVLVWRFSGPAVEFEILCRNDRVGADLPTDQLAFFVPESSITWPAACSGGNVIGVAGVNFDLFNSPPGAAGIHTSYSSQGPTNDGRRGVDLTGATRTSVGSGGNFIGTSCASPNAAGAAAALWSSQPNLDADNIRYLIYRKARLYKDWGSAGADPIYGHGGLYLYEYIENTKYVDRLVNNPNGLQSRVFQRLNHAFGAVPAPPAEGAVIIFGNNYSSPFVPTNYLMNKNVIMKSIDGNSLLGNN
jgi:hypothetical protein